MTSSHSFPPDARLHVSAEYQAVFGEGRRVSGTFFRLNVRLPLEGGRTRLGVTVSKRVDKRAVVRNRLRRQAKECFRLLRDTLPAGDYVLLAKPEAAKAESQAVHSDLLSLFHRARTLKPMAPPGTMPPSDAITGRPPFPES